MSRDRLFFFAAGGTLLASPTRFVTTKISAIDLGNRANIRHEFIIGCFIVSSESDLDPVPLLETAERSDNRAELDLGLHSHHEFAVVVREPEEIVTNILLLTVLLGRWSEHNGIQLANGSFELFASQDLHGDEQHFTLMSHIELELFSWC